MTRAAIIIASLSLLSCASQPISVEMNGNSFPAILAGDVQLDEDFEKHPSISPRMLTRVAPVYPKRMKEERIEGKVKLGVVINKNGDIDAIHTIYATNIYFQKAAINALKQNKFSPGEKDGEKTRTYIEVPVTFQLN